MGYPRITREQALIEGWFQPNDSGVCWCGCGTPTERAEYSNRTNGTVAGEYRRYAPGRGHQARKRGVDANAWKTGRYQRPDGYVSLWVAGEGILLEHRKVMGDSLGRDLTRNETVHHRNGIRNDNRIENLELRVGQHGPGATHCWNCGVYLTQ